MICHSVRELMQPLLDEELDAGRSSEIEHHLQGCVACAELYHHLNELRTTIRGGAPYYSAPEHLAGRIQANLRASAKAERALRLPWAWMSAAAAVGFAAAILLALLTSRFGTPERNSLANEVVSSHIRSLMPGHAVDVPSSDQHTVKPWFNGKIDFSPQVKDLSPEGFALKGGRLDYLDGRTIAVLVFQRRQHIINLFVWPQNATSRPANAPPSVNGFNVIQWTAGGMAYWAVSDLKAEELNDFVRHYKG